MAKCGAEEKLIVPKGCIPLIGYRKKPSSLLEIKDEGRNFLEERATAISIFKKNHRIPKNKIRNKAKKKRREAGIVHGSPVEVPLPVAESAYDNYAEKDTMWLRIKCGRSAKVSKKSIK